jgi:HSP20 family protein
LIQVKKTGPFGPKMAKRQHPTQLLRRGAIMANPDVTPERTRPNEPSRSFFRHPLVSLQDEIDRAFGDFFQGFDLAKLPALSSGAIVPKADFSESESGYELAVEIPGVPEKDLNVSVRNGVLTVKGEKKSERDEKKKDYYRSERSYGSYCRSMTLPEDADEPQISAHYADGVLRIVIPKSAEAKTKSQTIVIQKG